jgi:hypothetical protein
MASKVTFIYEPDEPDEDDPTGISSEEFERLHEQLAFLGAYDIKVEKIS